jgi:hypothetical protein
MTLPTRFDGTRLRRRVARVVTATTVTAMTLAAALLGAAPASAKASAALSHTVYVSSSTSPALRDCYHPTKQPFPNTNCTLRFYLTPGSAVTLICQYPGQQVGNDSYWDYVQTGNGYGYVTDWYINNPSAPSAPYRDTSVPICNY